MQIDQSITQHLYVYAQRKRMLANYQKTQCLLKNLWVCTQYLMYIDVEILNTLIRNLAGLLLLLLDISSKWLRSEIILVEARNTVLVE